MFRKKIKRRLPDVNLTPLIDTALTLLVIFMITVPMMDNTVRVSLPKGVAQDTAKDAEKVVVHIDIQGAIFLNGTEVAQEQLADAVEPLVQGKDNVTAFVRADEKVLYENVIGVVDRLKMISGISCVALVTRSV